jgi:hypothetical protein
MAFSDIGTFNFGTWHRSIAPVPGDPVTVYWMGFVADNIARVSRPLSWIRDVSIPVGGSLQFNLATMPCSGFPFAKMYVKLVDGWTDRYSSGEESSWVGRGDVTSYNLRFISTGSAEATLATLEAGEACLMAFGGNTTILKTAAIFWGK